MKIFVAVLLAVCVSFQAGAAGSVNSAKVVQVRIDEDGRGMVIFDRQMGGAPATCVQPAYANALSFNANAAGGKGIMAVALTAKSLGAVVTAYGNGGCGTYGAYVEDWSYGVMQ